MQIKNNVLVVTTRVILHHPPARDPRKKRLRREGYVRNRASLPGAPESRLVALVEDDEPGPGDEVQDVFPPGVGRGHNPLDGPRVEITANDNVPSGAEHAEKRKLTDKLSEITASTTETVVSGMFVITLSMAVLVVTLTRVEEFMDQFRLKEIRTLRIRWVRGSLWSITKMYTPKY
ncbi:hypothetical protein J6590_005991 [Homalodisca vitripennis]|nr:hypothetical protein J6590_005991 [Homalodisca vitripennis]